MKWETILTFLHGCKQFPQHHISVQILWNRQYIWRKWQRVDSLGIVIGVASKLYSALGSLGLSGGNTLGRDTASIMVMCHGERLRCSPPLYREQITTRMNWVRRTWQMSYNLGRPVGELTWDTITNSQEKLFETLTGKKNLTLLQWAQKQPSHS